MAQKKAEIKICYIGGGSRDWAPKLISDLALCPLLSGELVLFDIDYSAALRNVEVADALFGLEESQTSFSTRATGDAADALKNADFVVFSIEPGPTQMRYADLVIPEKYGVYHTVGDTIGPGGLFRALRAVPIKMHYAELIMEQCPNAWVINYTNPMTLCTAALYEAAPDIKAFGCCHEVFGTQKMIAELVAQWFDVEQPSRHEIECDIAGINHFTVVTSARWNGIELMPHLRAHACKDSIMEDKTKLSLERKKNEQWFHSDKCVAFDYLRRLDVLGAAGDRHLMENVPWYTLSEAEIHRRGVVRTPFEWRVRQVKEKVKTAHDLAEKGLQPTPEEGVEMMCALSGVSSHISNVNIPNTGQYCAAPEGHVVETYARFSHNALTPIKAAVLPFAAQECVNRVIAEQQLALHAAIENDMDYAIQALMLDPMTHLSTDDIHAMCVEACEYMREYLPDWEI